MTAVRSTFLLATFSIALTACSGRDGEADTGSAVVEREKIGDTTVVRTVSGSAWGDTARLVEDLRIGAVAGRPEENFGAIADIEIAKDGSIYVYDGQAVEIRQFDSTGAFVRTLGRRGEGPGEHMMLGGIALQKDERLTSYDTRTNRVNRYAKGDGETESWPVPLDRASGASPWIGTIAVAVDSADRVLMLVSFREMQDGKRVTRPKFLRVSLGDSTIDTLPVPTFPPTQGDVRFGPRGLWALHPNGYFIAGTNDRYSFDLLRPEGVLRIQRDASPPDFVPEERAELEADIQAAGPNYSVSFSSKGPPVTTYGDMPTLAKVKPLYRSIIAGRDGRIWVAVHTRAQKRAEPVEGPPRGPSRPGMPAEKPRPPRYWVEPTVYDVFEPDGRYLGAVTVPDGITIYGINGDRAWGTTRGESDEEYVVRLRLDRSARAAAGST